MKKIINSYSEVVVQIATPYSTGTGFYLKKYNLIVTNEHVVRDNRNVIVKVNGLKKQLSQVLYLDPTHDLAFLEMPDAISLHQLQNCPECSKIKFIYSFIFKLI